MLKKMGVLGVTICVCLTMINNLSQSFASNSSNDVVISNVEDLVQFRDSVNSGTDYSGKIVVLQNDIDLSSLDEWVPIGNGKRLLSIAMGKKFMGIFDGQNHSIIGMKISESKNENDAKGFFGIIDKAIVKNIQFKSANVVVPKNKLGAIAVGMMVNGSTVDNIKIDQASHISVNEGAGVVGRMIKSGVIQNCINYSNIDAVYTGAGIVNKAYYTAEGSNMVISQCKNYGNVQGVTYASGGIVSLSASDVQNCYNEGKISAKTEAGGIVGEQKNFGTIQDCENKGSVQAEISGGIVGWIRYENKLSDYARTSSISVLNNKNSATIEVDSQAGLLSTGGIVGLIYNQANVKNNINTAPQIIGSLFASGIAGAYQIQEDNWLEENPSVNVFSNFSSTPIENISGSCKALYIYDNKGVTLNLKDNYSEIIAKIDNKSYGTLLQAIKESTENDTIILLKDTTLKTNADGEFKEGASVTLDLNKNTITGDNENSTLRVVDNGNVRITNGKILAINDTYCTVIADKSKVELDNVELKNSRGNGNSLKSFENSTITLRNVSSTSYKGGGVEAAGGVINIYESSFTQEEYFDWNSQIVAASNGGVVNVHQGKFTGKGENYGAYIFNSGGTINIYDGEWSAGKAVIKADKSVEDTPSIVNVYGGEFDGKISIADGASLNIYGGVFKNTGLSQSDFSKYVKSTSSVYESDGVFTVIPKADTVTLNKTALPLEVGKSETLVAKLNPVGAIDPITWTSSDKNIATVDATGKVTAVAEGTATITATAGGKAATCTVTVKKVEVPVTPPVEPEKPIEPEKPVVPDKPTVEVPTIDTTTPPKEVTVGVQDKASQEVVADTVSSILSNITSGKEVSKEVMSEKTLQAVKDALSEGKEVTPKVEAKTIDVKTVDKTIVSKVNELVEKFSKVNETKATVAQYLDLGVLLMADAKELGTVNQLDKAIEFTVALPTDLVKEGRVFYVVRIHNGVAEKLTTTMNEDGTLTFETDKFSTYAIVYEEGSKKEEVKKDEVVKTNDSSQILLWMTTLGFGLFVGARNLIKTKEEL